jgi:phage/plasmid-associated DNA primase
VSGYSGDPSKLRLLISGDGISAERKYKECFDFQPDCLVVLSSNVLWNPKDSSTGLQRRIIYVPITTVPKKVDRHLFYFNQTTNECSGTLADSLPGLLNWALNNPNNNLSLLDNAVEANKLIDPHALNDSNHLIG